MDDNLVTQKGRVAAEIQSADELVLTELIFNSNLKVRQVIGAAQGQLIRDL